jgi:hypothetical protein
LHYFITARFVDHAQAALRAQRRGSGHEREDGGGSAGSYTHRFLQCEMSCAHIAH